MTLYSARTKKKPQMSHMRVSVRKLTSISLFCSDNIWTKNAEKWDIKFNERNSANQIMNNQNTVVNLQLNQIEGVNDPDGREENGEQKIVGKEETQIKIQISHMSI
uniref:Uncharacterized protein n=1 Tax=Vespula pensylvanica TaxID=30213 RepID=A0A834K1H8_VESPE|nr:hypothetical protein H0235_016340 [Vespula pensylvanica]